MPKHSFFVDIELLNKEEEFFSKKIGQKFAEIT